MSSRLFLISLQDVPKMFKDVPNITLTCLQGAQEVDQQWINSGAKQCSQHLNNKISFPICFFLDQTK